jgi:p-hydroxybenzoate 3-monooxygenase
MTIKTQVGIIGAGPAGLSLSLLLAKYGISSVIIENRSRQYVEARVRAGLLEQNTVNLMKELGIADRLEREGFEHHGVYLSFNGVRHHIPFQELTGGRCITIYGQQEVVKDMIAARLAQGGDIYFEASATKIEGLEDDKPTIYFTQQGENHTIECDFVAGCDGYHGISRATIPTELYNEYKIEYPFSWLGILAYAKPSSEELIYAYHERGFALSSLRSDTVSRLYIQVSNDDKVENWTDEQIWDELDKRLSDGTDFKVNRGEIFEKGITPMRSFMIDNMQYKRLFIAGDAAHIVPPTGGKGLNLAVADIRLMAAAFKNYYENGTENLLESYSEDCLRRIWRAQDFSNLMTTLFHKQTEHGSFAYQLQKAKFDYVGHSEAYKTTIAENYVGLKEI